MLYLEERLVTSEVEVLDHPLYFPAQIPLSQIRNSISDFFLEFLSNYHSVLSKTQYTPLCMWCEAAIQKVSIFIFSIILHKMRKSLLHSKYPFAQAKKTKRAEGGGEYVGVPWYLAFLKVLRLFVFSTRYNNLRPFKSKMWVTVFDNGQQPARAGTNWNKLFFFYLEIWRFLKTC